VIGGYPGAGKHRMPVCCEAMRSEKRAGDEIVFEPPKGKGASLTIRYRLPR
jgi:5-methylcytosine-specific restriction protein A